MTRGLLGRWRPKCLINSEHWQFLQRLRGLDYREKYHSFALTQSEDWLLPFNILWEKLIIDSILNMPFEFIYIRLENAPGLIYFSFVPTVKHQCFENTLFHSLLSRCPWELPIDSAPTGASSFKSLLHLEAVFSLPPSGNAAKYLKLLWIRFRNACIFFTRIPSPHLPKMTTLALKKYMGLWSVWLSLLAFLRSRGMSTVHSLKMCHSLFVVLDGDNEGIEEVGL